MTLLIRPAVANDLDLIIGFIRAQKSLVCLELA